MPSDSTVTFSGTGRRASAFVALFFAFVASGCASSGAFQAVQATEVRLDGADYEIVATDVAGQASAGYLLGVSGGPGPRATTIAVARISGPGSLYQAALEDLWGSFEERHGEVEGRQLALANVRFDVDALNLLIYTRPTLHVRADVVEFQE